MDENITFGRFTRCDLLLFVSGTHKNDSRFLSTFFKKIKHLLTVRTTYVVFSSISLIKSHCKTRNGLLGLDFNKYGNFFYFYDSRSVKKTNA